MKRIICFIIVFLLAFSVSAFAGGDKVQEQNPIGEGGEAIYQGWYAGGLDDFQPPGKK